MGGAPRNDCAAHEIEEADRAQSSLSARFMRLPLWAARGEVAVTLVHPPVTQTPERGGRAKRMFRCRGRGAIVRLQVSEQTLHSMTADFKEAAGETI